MSLVVLCGGGCAGEARRAYADAALDDVPGAPATAEAREAALAPVTSLGAAPLTLTRCLALALSSSSRLAARGERLAQADGAAVEAITHILPRAAFDMTYTRDSDVIEFNGQAFQPKERVGHGFTISETVFDARLLPAYRLATQTRRLDALLLHDARDELLFRTCAAFYEVLGDERDLEAVRAALARVDEQLRVLQVQQGAGMARRQDVLITSARRSEVEVELVQAQVGRDAARARLARLVGAPLGGELVDTLDVTPPRGDVEALVARALEARPSLAAARAQVDVAAEREHLALAELLPTVELRYERFTRAEGGFEQFLDDSFSATLHWDFFDPVHLARISTARSARREQALLADDAAADVRLEVVEAALALSAIERSLGGLEARAEAAAAAHELAVTEQRAGDATPLDVLVGEEAREDAERNLQRAGLARKLAALRVWLVTGELVHARPVAELFGS